MAGQSESDDGFAPARAALLEAALARAPFEGWTTIMIARAAQDAGLARPVVAAAFPKGVADLLAYWSAGLDAAMTKTMAPTHVANLKIREKVPFGVRARLAALRPHKEAARRAAATLALPLYAGLATGLIWRTADAIWRALDDKSTDFNFYSKRAILCGVWATTFARWLADDSDGDLATNEFLDRRIDNVMSIEKAKARLRDSGFDPGALVSALARLRYPGR